VFVVRKETTILFLLIHMLLDMGEGEGVSSGKLDGSETVRGDHATPQGNNGRSV